MQSTLLRCLIAFGATGALAAGVASPATALLPGSSEQGADIIADTTNDTSTARVELLGDRTSNSRTFLDSDGGYQTEIYTSPIHFRDPEGNWRVIDNTLVPTDNTDYLAVNEANDYQLLIPKDAGSDPVRVHADGEWVSFTAEGSDGTPQVAGTEAMIPGLGPDTELQYEATNTGVKETIVLSEPPATAPEWSFDLNMSPGLAPRLTSAGGIDVVDDASNVAFRIPPPFMFDSRLPSPARSNAVDFQLSSVDSHWRLTVAAADAWLQDPSRVFPVMVDPTITVQPPIKDCWISAQSPNTSNCGADSPYLRVGVSNGEPRRSLLKFNLSTIHNEATITDAQLELYMDATQSTTLHGAEYVARRVIHGWTNEVTWNTHNGVNLWTAPGGDFASRTYAGTGINGSTSGYKSFDSTPMVETWVSGADENSGMIVKQQAEDTNNVLYFYSSNAANDNRWPRLSVSWYVDDLEDSGDLDILDDTADAEAIPMPANPDNFAWQTETYTTDTSFRSLTSDGGFTANVPDANWPACGIFDDDYKLVRRYNRIHRGAMLGSIVNFRCGNERFGYKHLLFRNHDDHWQDKANLILRNWRDLANWAMDITVIDPDKLTYNAEKRTWCFSREFYFIRKSDGEIIATMKPHVVTGHFGRKLITAFPSSRHCTGDNRL